MDSKIKNNNSIKQSDKLLTFPTETRDKTKVSSFELINDKPELTLQELKIRQKLLFFISDKHKFCFKSCFDHKGTKAFLNSREEAMKKIVLNEYIEEDRHKSDKLVKHHHKKLKKLNSVTADLKFHKLNKNEINKEEESIKKKKKKNKHISTEILSNLGENKLIELKNEFDNIELEKWEPHSPNNRKRRKSIENQKNIEKKADEKPKKNKHLKNKINIDKSINSIATVNSKLFSNKNEYDNFKRFVTKDDMPILEDILVELDVNKK